MSIVFERAQLIDLVATAYVDEKLKESGIEEGDEPLKFANIWLNEYELQVDHLKTISDNVLSFLYRSDVLKDEDAVVVVVDSEKKTRQMSFPWEENPTLTPICPLSDER